MASILSDLKTGPRKSFGSARHYDRALQNLRRTGKITFCATEDDRMLMWRLAK